MCTGYCSETEHTSVLLGLRRDTEVTRKISALLYPILTKELELLTHKTFNFFFKFKPSLNRQCCTRIMYKNNKMCYYSMYRCIDGFS